MVLDDVAGRADAVVVAGPAAHPDVLGHGDLHVIHVVGVPDRLIHLVGEAQRQDVLHRLLAQVVVDPEHAVRREHRLHDRVELARCRQVAAEGFLDHHAPPLAVDVSGETRVPQLLGHLGERLRRNRQVERVVAHRPARPIQLRQRLLQHFECPVVVELALDEADALGQLVPDGLVEGRARVFRDGVVNHLREVLVLPVAAGESDQAEPRRQQPAVGQVVDGGHELLAGQVARHPEDDERARAGDAVQSAIGGQPQRVELRRDFHR